MISDIFEAKLQSIRGFCLNKKYVRLFCIPCILRHPSSTALRPNPKNAASAFSGTRRRSPFSQVPGEGIVRLRRTVDSASSAYASVFLRKTVRLDRMGSYPLISTVSIIQYNNFINQIGIFYWKFLVQTPPWLRNYFNKNIPICPNIIISLNGIRCSN